MLHLFSVLIVVVTSRRLSRFHRTHRPSSSNTIATASYKNASRPNSSTKVSWHRARSRSSNSMTATNQLIAIIAVPSKMAALSLRTIFHSRLCCLRSSRGSAVSTILNGLCFVRRQVTWRANRTPYRSVRGPTLTPVKWWRQKVVHLARILIVHTSASKRWPPTEASSTSPCTWAARKMFKRRSLQHKYTLAVPWWTIRSRQRRPLEIRCAQQTQQMLRHRSLTRSSKSPTSTRTSMKVRIVLANRQLCSMWRRRTHLRIT